MSSKQQIIDERKANLPLPEQPPTASDFNSANERTVNVGSGGVASGIANQGADALRGPATATSDARIDGEEWKTNAATGASREAKDGLRELPNDAVAREKKGNTGFEDTTSKDYGYPQENDPSSGIKR